MSTTTIEPPASEEPEATPPALESPEDFPAELTPEASAIQVLEQAKADVVDEIDNALAFLNDLREHKDRTDKRLLELIGKRDGLSKAIEVTAQALGA